MLSKSISFLVKCSRTNTVWLFNCPEGCQNILMQKKINLQQIKNIFLTSFETENIAGLIGLLSSFSLNTKMDTLNIYGPYGLLRYLQFLKKYAQTTFKYNLKISTIEYGFFQLTSSCNLYILPALNHSKQLECIFIEKEKIGRFKPLKAQSFHIPIGPLYGKIKLKYRLLLADGLIITRKDFTHSYYKGLKIIIYLNKYGSRNATECALKSDNIIRYKL
jgi:ribonuclease Z|uniref:Ribonuclease Z n=1 Tax=Kumanoa mahlacensis TaxID=1196387 RepID=A0A8K1YUE1_9FLOR|nr:Ribonuclease Z [Kumanoa mahlacensis]